jgi:hypothetical protein
VVAVKGPAQGDAATPPEGWDTTTEKTGAPPGIDQGWGYAPGATWHPDLDKYPFSLARKVVTDNLADGVFARWLSRIEKSVAEELTKPAYAGLSKAETVAALRKALGREELYPAAVLPPQWKERMGAQTHAVMVSDYDLIKQAVSRQGQDFEALHYLSVQQVLDDARVVVGENAQMTIFVSNAAGKWYAAILQRTETGKGVFFKSFRRSTEKDARRQAQKGEVWKSDL